MVVLGYHSINEEQVVAVTKKQGDIQYHIKFRNPKYSFLRMGYIAGGVYDELSNTLLAPSIEEFLKNNANYYLENGVFYKTDFSITILTIPGRIYTITCGSRDLQEVVFTDLNKLLDPNYRSLDLCQIVK